MAKLGFGGYRISVKSQEHREALELAVEDGCEIIDTSSNYTDGDSERLIGEVLEKSNKNPLLISKVGYIQGTNLETLDDVLTEKIGDDLVVINEGLKHSIHPAFIEDQLKRSLERLGVESIDVYLLHNPEYYLKTEKSNKKEYYSRIEKAFVFLEKMVRDGKIKSYGISSNTFVDPKEDHESTDLQKIIELTQKNKLTGFKYIQFPLNLLELGALQRQFDGDHLIELAQKENIKTIINRPLNAFTEQGLLRLANYRVDKKLTDEYAEELFVENTKSLVELWEKNKEEGDEGLFEIPLFRQISTIWYKQNSTDAVDQIFYSHFFPFIASIWGSDLTKEESEPFYELFETAYSYVHKNMNKRADQFKQTAINQGLLFESEKNLECMAIEKYFSFGVDIVLVGMRKKTYVEKLKEYFTL